MSRSIWEPFTESGALTRTGISSFIAICLVVLSPLEGSAQSADKPSHDARKYTGRIFLVSTKLDDPISGVVAVHPESGVIQKIIEDNFRGTRVSPDGHFVASTGITACGRASIERGIWVYDALGKKQPVKVFDGVSIPCGWSRDGSEVLISSARSRTEFETWRVKVDGSGKQLLPVAKTEIVNDWSPDGRWLLSWSTRKRPEMPYYMLSPDGQGERLLLGSYKDTLERGGRIGPSPQFSPDGRGILANHFIDDESRPPKLKMTELLVLVVESGGIRRFCHRDAANHTTSACWSPDGKAIAAVSQKENGPVLEFRVEIIDLQGQSIRTIPLPVGAAGPWIVGWK